ncbi:MAG TPA: carnitine dehydratase, partial [Gammaproteobacteria bacterium]|nr:carnitine dehydratase [Gammaproteobacteria bacterium]
AFMWSSDMGSQTFVGKEVDVARAATFIDLIYETKTHYISVSVMSNEQWQGLCRAVEHMEWLDDDRFKTPGSRDRYANERLELIQSALLENTGEYWLDTLEKCGVPCAPVLKRSEMIQHPQVQASEIVIQTKHPHAGELRQARNAARFETTETEIRYGAPQLGEHTRAVLKEFGYSADQIDTLFNEGAVSDYETNSEPEKQS